MYHHLDVNGLSDGRVVFKLELEPEHPGQPSLLMRSPGGQQEQPLEFLAQSNGRDYFRASLPIGCARPARMAGAWTCPMR